MQNIIKKQGQVSIISIVSLIAVSIVLIVVLISSFKTYTPSLSPIACTQENLKPSIQITSVCFDQNKNELQVKLKREITSSEISILDFNLISPGNTAKWRCANSCGDCEILNAGEEKTYYLNEIVSSATLEIYSDGCLSAKNQILNPEPC